MAVADYTDVFRESLGQNGVAVVEVVRISAARAQGAHRA